MRQSFYIPVGLISVVLLLACPTQDAAAFAMPKRLSTLPNWDEIGEDSIFLAQITSVSQLSDVQPTDFYYSSLASLVERYGVGIGYPDGTFRGNTLLSSSDHQEYMQQSYSRLQELAFSCGLTGLNPQQRLASALNNLGLDASPGMTRGDFAISLNSGLDYAVEEIAAACP